VKKKDRDEYLERLVEARAAAGDAVAANVLGSLYLDRSIRELDATLLEVAEEKFKLSSRLGHAKATEFLEGIWPMIKLEYAGKIARKRMGNGSDDKPD
jgi:hypothetical protein